MKWIIIILNEKISVCVRRTGVSMARNFIGFSRAQKFLNTIPTGLCAASEEVGQSPLLIIYFGCAKFTMILSFSIHATRGGMNHLHYCIVKSLSVRSKLTLWFHSGKSIWSERCEEVMEIHAVLVPVTSSWSPLLAECAALLLQIFLPCYVVLRWFRGPKWRILFHKVIRIYDDLSLFRLQYKR